MTGFACGYLGLKISYAMKIRAESLNNIITSLEMLESEINFSMNKLKQAFMRVDKCGLFKFAAENMDEKGVFLSSLSSLAKTGSLPINSGINPN